MGDVPEETPEERSRRHAEEKLSDPEYRAYVEQSLERLRNTTSTPLTKAEFLALTEDSIAQCR